VSRKGANKQKERERQKKYAKWTAENETIERFRRQGPHIKRILAHRGIDLPFYDFLDSYVDEFNRTCIAAKSEHPSLLGIHEVDDSLYYKQPLDWTKFGYRGLESITLQFDRDLPDYGRKKGDAANMAGYTHAFRDEQKNLRTVVLIRRSIKLPHFEHREYKYALKVASLLHEIGHVEDFERGINFDLATNRLDIIEAEVFANLFCLDRLLKRNLAHSFEMVLGALQKSIPKGGYLGEVGRLVVERVPPERPKKWTLEGTPTDEEVRMLGPEGVRAFSSN